MLSPRAVLEDTDWEGLEHAYGLASDAPAHLAMLLSGDPEQCGEALAYLDAAILHQGTIYSATAPAAVFATGILDDPRTLVSCEAALPGDDRRQPVRAALLEWLGLVAESAAYGEADGGETGEAVHACRSARADLSSRIEPFLTDAHPAVRACASLVPVLDGDPRALEEIRSALRDPLAADSWFGEKPPQLDGRLRFALVAATWPRAPGLKS